MSPMGVTVFRALNQHSLKRSLGSAVRAEGRYARPRVNSRVARASLTGAPSARSAAHAQPSLSRYGTARKML